MGLFTRKRSRRLSVVELPGGAYCAVAGESHYGEAIARTLETCWSDDRDDRVFQAILMSEPSNRFDPHAVSVWSSCGQLGYLPREEASLYGPVFDAIRDRGYDAVVCEAVMKGGTPDKPNIGIVLRLSRPESCLAEMS